MAAGGGEEEAEWEEKEEEEEVPGEEEVKEEEEEGGMAAVARAGTSGSRCTWGRRLSPARRARNPSGCQPCPETLSCSVFSARETEQEGRQNGSKRAQSEWNCAKGCKNHIKHFSLPDTEVNTRRIIKRVSTHGRVESGNLPFHDGCTQFVMLLTS